jgi:hypothetical protein
MPTMGEIHPILLLDPRHAELAAKPFPSPPIGAVTDPPAIAFDGPRHRDLKLLILECDYRGDPALECGCTKTRICLMGKGKPLPGTDTRDVTYQDCLKCVKGEI